MENKEELDRFAQIAVDGKKLRDFVENLSEIKPLKINRFSLPKIVETVPVRESRSEEELYKDFLKEKEDLKNKFEPFLMKYSSNIPSNKEELNEFYYRKEEQEDLSDFSRVLNKGGDWEKVTTPHFIGISKIWSAYYLKDLSFKTINKDKEYLIEFESIDYQADIYFNGRLLTSHIGFFAPFTVDITPYVREGNNRLVIIVKNYFTTNGIGEDGLVQYGMKNYACTNIGYDEPNLGWHHCPSGIGIIGKIHLITANKARISDVFVRPNIDTGEIAVKTTYVNYYQHKTNLKVYYSIEGRNFKETIFENKEGRIVTSQRDENYLLEKFTLSNFKLWTLDEPYLYDITITLKDENNQVIDQYQTHFGMRKFHMDLKSKPYKGQYYFNNEKIILRGTNEMGHLSRAVMENNIDQLIDDILIAKVANLNFYRITQRPPLKQIMDYFDMLGMLCQSDFPSFSYLTYEALKDAYNQVLEMERLTRNHPSVVVETFCNETLDAEAWDKDQYVISRLEIEKFFEAGRQIIELENPDRVVKYNEGDYSPLSKTYGISDFHCYNFWYICHAMQSGKMNKGYLPPIRSNYMCGCGEYGVDGLDREELLRKYCPKEWLPETNEEPWAPNTIAKAQCYSLHGDFFPEQENMKDWIRESRIFQQKAIKNYVDILRFRSDYLESTAVHLLIDAWPCGWTKTLLDVERMPKPAFYAFKEANIPLRVRLRRDQYTIYSNQKMVVEVYAYNDYAYSKEVDGIVSIHYGDKVSSFRFNGLAKEVGTTYLGEIEVSPQGYVGDIKVVSSMSSEYGRTYDEIDIVSKKINKKATKTPVILAKEFKSISLLCEKEKTEKLIFVNRDYYLEHKKELEDKILKGSNVVINMTAPIKVFDEEILFKLHPFEGAMRANNFLARNPDDEITKEFKDDEFQNFYSKKDDYQVLSSWIKYEWNDSTHLLYSFFDDGKEEHKLHKAHRQIVSYKKYGEGHLVISTLSCLDGCITQNPVLDKFFINLINKFSK